MSAKTYILSARRTPIGRYGGGLASVTPVELARTAVTAALDDAGLKPEQADGLILGMARQAGNGPNPGRQVSIAAGLPQERPAHTVNQACASGLLSIAQARDLIRLGEAEVVIAAGAESMSRVPYLLPDARWGQRMGHAPVVDGMNRDGFVCPLADQKMGRTAETLAQQHDIPRSEQDEYAAGSQAKAGAALDAGHFAAELSPVTISSRKGDTTIEADEHPRPGTTAEKLAKLPPVFLPADEGGTVHAGNSSGITDGAAAVIVASEAAVEKHGLTPLASIRDATVTGVDPKTMGIGPVPATQALFERQGLSWDDVDLVELNEAFAAQVLACVRELDLPTDKLNVNGGAIALGHPIGCTGTRIAVTLLHEMKRRDVSSGLATLCVSGGLGFSMLFERA
ncbi:MAG: thiolase family protein [Acidobacteriota bacterium]